MIASYEDQLFQQAQKTYSCHTRRGDLSRNKNKIIIRMSKAIMRTKNYEIQAYEWPK